MAGVICLSMLVAPLQGGTPNPHLFELVQKEGSGAEVVIGHVWVEQNPFDETCVEHWTLKAEAASHPEVLNGRMVAFKAKSAPVPASLTAFHATSAEMLSATTLTTYDNSVSLIAENACGGAVGACTKPFGTSYTPPPPPPAPKKKRGGTIVLDPMEGVLKQIDTGITIGLVLGATNNTYGFAYRPGASNTEHWIFDTQDGLRTPQGDADDFMKMTSLDATVRSEVEFRNCACEQLGPKGSERYYRVNTTVGIYTP